MSSYTTEVRYICESYAGETHSTGFSSIDAVLDKCVDKVFDFTFPIFDENYRIPLEKKILKHFYTREICEETVGLWKLRLEETLDDIMPYYNQLYKTQLDHINPWYNVDLTTEHTGTGTKDTDGTTSGKRTESDHATDDTSYDGFRERTTTNETDRMSKGTIKTVNYGGDKITKENGTEGGWSKNIQDHSDTEKGKETSTDSIKRSEISNTNASSRNVDRYSDTPQGSLDNMNAIETNLYLTNARIVTNSNSSTTNDNETTKTTGEKNDTTTTTAKTTDNYTRGLTDARTKTETFSGRNDRTVNSGTDTNDKTGVKDVSKSGTVRETKNNTETENTTGTRNEKIKTTEDYIEHVSGYKGVKSIAAMIMEWRNSLINIDAMIMKDLEDCFFQLW